MSTQQSFWECILGAVFKMQDPKTLTWTGSDADSLWQHRWITKSGFQSGGPSFTLHWNTAFCFTFWAPAFLLLGGPTSFFFLLFHKNGWISLTSGPLNSCPLSWSPLSGGQGTLRYQQLLTITPRPVTVSKALMSEKALSLHLENV